MKGHSAFMIQGVKGHVFLFDIRVRIAIGSKEMMLETDLKHPVSRRQKLSAMKKNLGKKNYSYLGLNISQCMLLLPNRLYIFLLRVKIPLDLCSNFMGYCVSLFARSGYIRIIVNLKIHIICILN